MWLFRSGFVVLSYTLLIAYAGVKVLRLLRYFFPSFRFFVFWPLFFVLCYSTVIVYLLRLERVQGLRQAAMSFLPGVVYLCICFLLLDGILLVPRLRKISVSAGVRAAGTGIALGIAVLTLAYGYIHARNIHTARYEITLKETASISPFRISAASDLHIGTIIGKKWISNVVDKLMVAEPDLICLAGDIFDGNLDELPDSEGVKAELRRLKAPLGVYACAGNHDRADTDRIRDFLRDTGVIFLQDEVQLLDNGVYLAGRRDARPIGGRAGRKSAAELTGDLDGARPLIVMDHQPVDYPALDAAGADLILSGHTHRGQLFPGNIATAQIYKKAGAVHYGRWRGNAAQGVVSSGAGLWGISLRVATNSEVIVIDLKF